MRLWLVCLLFELLTVATRCTIAVITQAQFLSDDESTLYPLQSGKKDRVRKPQMRTISKSGSSEVNSQSSQTSLLRLSSRFESRTDNFPTTSLQFRSNGSPCFPAVYAVTLQNGHCSRRVSTKMCYGQCTSYSHLSRKPLSLLTEQIDVESVCNCCSPVGNVSVKRYTLLCTIGGRRINKAFYLPQVNKCRCRPCLSN
ncbi:uncharacterized protein LOC134180268 [Corticium candelabrum]|uniref:uncharacterized protein LOC134180268 n=1 Tax=Corticium candelabrum TaxID=121492 RepID=UPI002E264501|nr:uncharacterized protein LOC134180268 [Corticium candelabrum]